MYRHAVARLADGFYQRWKAVGRGLDACLFGGEIDVDLLGAGDFAQRPLHPTGATGAGHAGDRQVEGD